MRPGRTRAWRRSLGALALATLVALGGGPAAASADDQVEAFLSVPATEARTVTVTRAPLRSGSEVQLTLQLLGVAGRGADPTVLVTDEQGSLPARAWISGGGAQAPARTAVLLMDASGSMAGTGITGARQAAQVYAGAVGRDVRVGLVAFADRSRVLTPPTTDRTALLRGIGKLSAAGETALYDGLIVAAKQAGAKGNVVLLSDGGDTVSKADLTTAVTAIRASGARVDVVAFKTGESAPSPLDQIAAAGHGHVVQAKDAAGLGRAFTAAATEVPVDVTVGISLPENRTEALPVTLALKVAGSPYATRVTLPATAAQAPAPLQVESVPAVSTWWLSPRWVALISFVLLMGAVSALVWPADRAKADRQRRRQAMAAYGPVATPGGGGTQDDSTAVSSATAGVLQVSERMILAGGTRSAIALRLDRAGVNLLPQEWVVLRTSLIVIAAAAGFLVLHPRWLGLAVGAVVGWIATEVWLRWRQSRRCLAFAGQLADTLQVVASSLRSGFSLQQALAAAQENNLQPMSAELGRALAAARIGVALEDELDLIADRMRSEDWRMAVMAIRIQRTVGGNLAEVLSTTSRTLRERAAVTRQVRALSAEGRLSAYVLLAMPVLVGLFLLAVRRAYLEPLWTTLPGLVMLALGAVGMVVGSIWTFRVAKVEV